MSWRLSLTSRVYTPGACSITPVPRPLLKLFSGTVLLNITIEDNQALFQQVRVAYVKIFWDLEICQLALKRAIILASSVFTQLAWKFSLVFFHLHACQSKVVVLCICCCCPPKTFSHFQQNNWEIFGEMYFPRVNSNILSNSLEKLANFLISLKLEF